MQQGLRIRGGPTIIWKILRRATSNTTVQVSLNSPLVPILQDEPGDFFRIAKIRDSPKRLARISQSCTAMEAFPNSTVSETAVTTGFPDSEVNMDSLFQSLQNDPTAQSTGPSGTAMFNDPQLIPQSEFGRDVYEVVHVRIPRVRALAREVMNGM